MPLPWSELLVVQIGDSIASAFATKLLVDLGADCVIVESPADFDPVRAEGASDAWGDPDAGPLFTYLNWSKKSVACDYSRPDGIDLVNRICSSADVVVRHQFAGDLEEYWQDTADARPTTLIEVVLSPFGTTGPYAGYQVDSTALLALCGIPYTDGDPAREPLTIQPEMAEYFVGADATACVLAAMHWLRRTGEGMRIELAMYDSMLKFDEYNLVFPQAIGLVRKRFYSRTISAYAPDMYECRDGWLVLTATRNAQAVALLIERPELIDTPLFADPEYRSKHWGELDALMTPWMKSHDRDEIVARAQQLRISAAPVLGVDELIESDHVRERGGIRYARDSAGREVALVVAPFRLESYAPPEDPAPARGQHSEEWLRGLEAARGSSRGERAAP